MNYFLVLLAYLIGSIPCGLLVGKCVGVDVRQSGSGNIGATNVTRLLGKKSGIVTLAGDVCKALLPMILASVLLKDAAGESLGVWVAICGFAAFFGHLYPVYLKFKGGKGVATALGVFLFLCPLAVLIDIVIFVWVVGVSGYVSLGSLAAAAAMPFLIWLLPGAGSVSVFTAALISALIWLKHRENIVRLLNHEEKSWKKSTASE
ncbi:MAG: glycerol-3-phosphate 1-O-acyltransferase PlsY [Desulfobulbaceae bacterium]|nr:glycerol-3-phosphate 1-O-acyltransferase PlsY [Desulfobulbaceae bacterium]MCK5544097.1 glycerol-3-phosphate 1-O-acyltransferase PlsY [Desulfobulbaceae bacterium]